MSIEEFVVQNPGVSVTLIIAVADAVLGALPDRFVPYIGGLRRIARTLIKNVNTTAKCIPLVLLFTMIGCAGMSPSPICETDKPSLICEQIPQPEHSDILLQLANVQAIKQDVYSVQQALTFLDRCETMLSEQRTYKDMAQWLASEIENVDIEILILSNYLNQLQVDLPISNFDRQLLKKHIQNQKDMLTMYAASASTTKR